MPTFTAAFNLAKNAFAGLVGGTLVLSSTMKLQAMRVPAGVICVRTMAYYDDALEIGAGAKWIRAATQAAGAGRRQSADGAWWQIANPVIDPKMLGGRSSDRTTISTVPILEAVAVATGTTGTGHQPIVGSRKVVLTPPAAPAAYPAYSGAYVIDAEIVLTHGVHFHIMSGAELLAAPTFNGEGMITSLDNAVWQAEGVIVEVDGIVNSNSVAQRGVYPRTAARWTVAGRGKLINGTLGGFKLGSPTTSYKPFECRIGPLHIEAATVSTYAAAANGNDPNSIGFHFNACTDNQIIGLIVVRGYRTGYQDDGGNNNASAAIHVYASGSGSNTDGTGSFTGPLACGFRLNGSACYLEDLYCDTPTSMGNSAITDVYGVEFGTASSGVVVNRMKVLLVWDNLSRTDTYSSGICTVINHLSYQSDNAINNIDVRSVSSSVIKAKRFITGAGYGRLARSNVTSSASYTLGNGDITFERPGYRSRVSAWKTKNYLRNAAFQIWQRGAGPFDCTAAATRVFGPDRFYSLCDGTGGGKSMAQQVITPAESFNAQILKPMNALRLTRTGDGTSETYWRIYQLLPPDLLYALQNQAITFKLFVRLVSGSFTGSIKVGVEQNFGTGGSAIASQEQTVVAGSGALSSSFGSVLYPITVPSISGKILGTGARLGFYLSLPGGAYCVDVAAPSVTDGYEDAFFPMPDYQEELAHARAYYEQLSISNINGSQFVQCQPKANTPSCTTVNGTLGSATVNGVLVTDTQARANTLTFIAQEP